MKKLLTISVAAYQVEEYLEETLASFLIPEIMEDIEVLTIDDGSSDHTGEIAQIYEKKYPQTFRYIYQENSGHGETVNRGIEEASGIYFKTVDGDDWVEEKGIRDLVGYIKLYCNKKKSSDPEQSRRRKDALSGTVDVIVTDFWRVDGSTKSKIKKCSCGFLGVQYMKEYTFDEIADRTYLNMHAITYRTELLKEHPPCLDKHCFYVDAEYALFPMRFVQTVVFLPQPVYMYRLGREEQSMALKSMQKNCSHHEKVLKRVLGVYKEVRDGLEADHAQRERNIQDMENLFGAGDAPEERVDAVERYLAKGAAKLVASQMKIYLSYPVKRENKEKIWQLEKKIKREYPLVYDYNENKAVTLLRLTGFLLYPVAAKMLHRKL